MEDHPQKKKSGGSHNMGARGISRPSMRHHHKRGKQGGEGNDMMTQDQRLDMLRRHHRKTLWIYWTLIILGFWMVLSPLTFDYSTGVVQPSGGREVWLSLNGRIEAMRWSDILSGLGLMCFGWRALQPNRPVSVWICCFIGIWLSTAPVLFWAPTAVAYLNSTLVGALVIALSILIPGMPNMLMYMKMGGDVPDGWSYNPSSWPQRWIMIVTGFLGWVVSRYLAAYQLGYSAFAWDPFFGDSTMKVLNSSMSHALPVSDAGLGSLAYTFEFLMGFMGSPSRWRTMPWMVAFFGILVIPLGLVHIFLVISQPLTVGAWCTFCIVAAAIMLPMIPLEVDEVIAMGQHMVQAMRRGEKFWPVFWKGGTPVTTQHDQRSPALSKLSARPWTVVKASVWGMSAPRTLVLATLAGIWLMFSPAIFGIPIKDISADINHLCGALTMVVSVICMAEVLRIGRYANIGLGLAVAVAPWIVNPELLLFNANSTLTGLLIVALSFSRGPKQETYGLWERFIR